MNYGNLKPLIKKLKGYVKHKTTVSIPIAERMIKSITAKERIIGSSAM